jgi:MFS family permease
VFDFLKVLPSGAVRRSLTLSVGDAVLWALMFGLAENFIVPFTLLFGATIFEVSLLQGLAQVATGLGQMAGGVLIQRGGSRRRLARRVVMVHAVGWVVIFAGGWATHSAWVVILLYCGFLFVANLAGPGWMSWMNDLVPVHQRGLYWASRNRIAGLVQFAAIGAAGLVLFEAKRLNLEVPAYGVLFFLAFASRLAGAFCVGAQHEPPMHRSDEGRQMTFLAFLKDLRSSNFGRFAVFSVALNFSVVMIYPIIQVYLLQELKLDYLAYAAVTMTFTIASFVFMTYWGPLGDRFGNRRVLLASAFLLPLAALAWVFVSDWRLLIILQLASGLLVSGVNLATTNFLFDSVKPDKVAKTVAYFNALNTAVAFLGSVAGGALADLLKGAGWHWGPLGPLTTVFLVVALLRFAVLAVLGRRFREVRDTEPSPGLGYFYLHKPWQDVAGWVKRKTTRGSPSQ